MQDKIPNKLKTKSQTRDSNVRLFYKDFGLNSSATVHNVYMLATVDILYSLFVYLLNEMVNAH